MPIVTLANIHYVPLLIAALTWYHLVTYLSNYLINYVMQVGYEHVCEQALQVINAPHCCVILHNLDFVTFLPQMVLTMTMIHPKIHYLGIHWQL